MRDSRLRRAVGQYIRDMEERNRCLGYRKMASGRLRHFATWMEDRGVTCLSKLDYKHLSLFLTEELKGKKASYQAYQWNVIKAFLKYHSHELGRKFHYSPNGRDREVKWLTPEQMQFLLSQKLTPRENLIVCFGLYAGLRRCEVLRLTMADLYIAWNTGSLSVYAKGKVRPVPVHPDLRDALGEYIAEVDYGPGDRAIPIGAEHYSLILRRIALRTGVPCTSHTLRRSFVRFLNSKRVPLPTIMAISGHSNPETTMRYIGAPMDDMREALQEIPSRLVRETARLTT